MTIHIARAIPADANHLTAITIASKRHWNYPESWIQLWLPVLTISPEYVAENEVWIAVEDDKPVAYYSLKQEGKDVWLDNLWVLPDFMGQGVGRQLFQHGLERAKARGVSTLKIEADPHAESFYEEMGARKVGEHWSEVDGQPRVLPLLEIGL